MECIKTESVLLETPRRKVVKPTKGKENPEPRSNSRSCPTDRSMKAAEFAVFSDDVRRELDPRGPFEDLLADHVSQSAWRLKSILDRQAARRCGSSPDGDDVLPKNPGVSHADRAAKSLRDALDSFDFLRARRSPVAIFNSPQVCEFEGNEWPILPNNGLEEFSDDLETMEQETPNWLDRLVFDFEVSDISPVVKGTWITVSHVVSLIVDGWTWADILRSHPELTEDDIRTCVSYAMAEENSTN